MNYLYFKNQTFVKIIKKKKKKLKLKNKNKKYKKKRIKN